MSEQWTDELNAFTRAFSGAAVFGIPLVMTMEMWWIGKSIPYFYLLAIFAVGFFANLGLAHVAGFRDDHSWLMSIDQAVDALAVGVISAVGLLLGMNQLRISDGIGQSIGMVIILAVPLSLGASVARQIFSGRVNRQWSDDDPPQHMSPGQELLADVGATAIGGVFIAISIAPTDEVRMIAAGLTWWHLHAVIVLSLLLSYMIVFASGFDKAVPPGLLQKPLSETVLCYVISLVVAFGMLILFGRLNPGDPVPELVRQTVALALPASIGGAAGRLVI